MGQDLGFGGEVAEFYRQYRRGYPPTVIDTLTSAFGLTSDDIVIDLGCGTGQLPAQQLPPPDQRTAFADQIRRAVAPYAPFTEHVPVRMLLGQRP